MTRLFVYGTLMQGGSNAAVLVGLRREAATARGLLYDLPAGYPALAVGDGVVHGELVHDVSDAVLAILDRYEGVAEGLYQRVDAPITVGARTVVGQLYLMTDPAERGGRLVRSGRWRVLRRRA